MAKTCARLMEMKDFHRQTPAISKLVQVSKRDLAIKNDLLK